MFGGDLFRAAWSAATDEAKKACQTIGSDAKALGNLAEEKAEEGKALAVKEIHKAGEAIAYGGKVVASVGRGVAAVGQAAINLGQYTVESLYGAAKDFTLRALGFPEAPCPLAESRNRLRIAMAKDEKVMREYPPGDPRYNLAKQQFALGQRALIAEDVYNDPNTGIEIPGFHRLSDAEISEKLHMTPAALHPSDSQFRAAVYENASPPPQYALAFKGTTMTSYSDWLNNAQQGLGIKSDY
jgi:hypothetical protein